jgi:prepilin signal peptidase PulO-like enzyme (type II secretory pathway)
VPLVSIVGVIFTIRFVSDTAKGLTYLAVVAVPPLAAVALAWACRPEGRAAPLRVTAAVIWTGALFAMATGHGLVSHGAATLLSALSCVTLGVLLAAVAPAKWLKFGIVAMAAADVWLVASDLLQHPNSVLVNVQPAPVLGIHLPRLQSELFGSVSMGYGDLFIAAVFGAVLAAEGRRQWPAALLTFALAAIFDLLFLVVNELPATVPVALALLAMELSDRALVPRWRRRRGWRVAPSHTAGRVFD